MEIKLRMAAAEEGDVPDWALRYNAKEYPRQAVTGDAVGLALDRRGDEAVLEALLITRGGEPFEGLDAWPGGFLDWVEDEDTLQAAIRELREETGVAAPEFVEALASYSTNGRDPRQFAGYRDEASGEWVARGSRVTTAAYLMLMRKEGDGPSAGDDAGDARWVDVYDFLPWEDLRSAAGRDAARRVLSGLDEWARRLGGDRRERIDGAWGNGPRDWNEERVPERYALMMEAGLVSEARRDIWGRAEPDPADARRGREMAFDHRRILADALG
ncbi:MAG TPA: NUDIX domain-containing protein, partial [Longimicrobium sp.]|nr:NUDIX domain-containing protein [Longimicrobium sp.]